MANLQELHAIERSTKEGLLMLEQTEIWQEGLALGWLWRKYQITKSKKEKLLTGKYPVKWKWEIGSPAEEKMVEEEIRHNLDIWVDKDMAKKILLHRSKEVRETVLNYLGNSRGRVG